MQMYFGSRIKQIYLNGDIKRGYIGSELFFSRSNTVTYHIYEGKTKPETIEVDYGEDVLNKYTPPRPSNLDSSWKFLGWKTNKDADGDVLSSKIMGSEPITLYAVFKQDINRQFVSYYNTTIHTEDVPGTRYYNNGTTKNAEIVCPTGKTSAGWTWRGWSARNDKAGNANVGFANGTKITEITSSGTHYGLYKLTKGITVTYSIETGMSSTAYKKTLDQYYSASKTLVYPVFTMEECTVSKKHYIFSGWGTTKDGVTVFAPGEQVEIVSDITLHALWKPMSQSTIWEGTIEEYGKTDTTMPVQAGIYDLTGFNYLKFILTIRNPNLEGIISISINGTKVKEYKDLQFSETTTVNWFDAIDISGYGKNSKITINRSGHDGDTKMSGKLMVYISKPDIPNPPK